MDSSKLYSSQCRKIGEALQPTTAYLLKLQQRMVATGFPKDDLLYLQVSAALESMRALAMQLHHRTFPNETGDLGPKTK
jgi:hypothetical protein